MKAITETWISLEEENSDDDNCEGDLFEEEKDDEDEKTDIESEEEIEEIFELFLCARHHCKRERKLLKTHVPQSFLYEYDKYVE